MPPSETGHAFAPTPGATNRIQRELPTSSKQHWSPSPAPGRATDGSCGPFETSTTIIYWAFVRRLNRQLAREPKIETVGSIQDLDSLTGIRTRAVPPSIEQELLVKEVMTFWTKSRGKCSP